MIHKAAGVIIQNRKLLVTRSRNRDFFIAPGGKLELGETVETALKRELKEELSIEIEKYRLLGTYTAPAIGNELEQLEMMVFRIDEYLGQIKPCAEVAEILWTDSKTEVKLGSIFAHEVIPLLKKQNLID